MKTAYSALNVTCSQYKVVRSQVQNSCFIILRQSLLNYVQLILQPQIWKCIGWPRSLWYCRYVKHVFVFIVVCRVITWSIYMSITTRSGWRSGHWRISWIMMRLWRLWRRRWMTSWSHVTAMT